MEFVGILRELARHRIALALSLIGAIALVIGLDRGSVHLPDRLSATTKTTYVASARLLVDARAEPLLDLDSGIADTLGMRAGLLADLLTTETAHREIARDVGITPEDLTVIGPAMGGPTVRMPLATRAAEAAQETTTPYAVRLATNMTIPIITLRANAPDAPGAARLATATRAALDRIVSSRRTRGAGLVVRPLGPVLSSVVVKEGNPRVGQAVVALLFWLWLVAIVILAGLLRTARKRANRPLMMRLAISMVIALACTVWNLNSISVSPLKVERRPVDIGAVATHLLLDSEQSWILDEEARSSDFASLTRRAELYGNLIASPAVVELIARRMGVAPDRIAAVPRITANVPDTLIEPDSEQRANQVRLSTRPYRLELQSDPQRPILNLYAEAPTTAGARRLASAAVAALREHLLGRLTQHAKPPKKTVRIDEVGGVRGDVINPTAGPQIAIVTFGVVFGVAYGLLLAAARVRRGWRGRPSPRDEEERELPGGDWPRTTRALPWLVAVFMAVIWLLPFNTIEIAGSLPFDLKLDRLVLPLLVGTWLLTMAVGGPGAPRLRATGMHAGIAGFVGVSCLGVVLSARYLNRTLELELATKKITLLVLYLVVFVMVASIVRRREVPAFMTYTLGLGLLCAVGTVWEYRFHYNVFYDLSDKILPGFFSVGQAEAGLADSAGRYLTRGPGEHPLEAVAMMSMVLPLALVRMLAANGRRRLLYGIAACVIVAAAISTYRKSALLAPLSVCLTLAYFRRRELLRLAPLALGFVVVIQVLAPGAASSILSQIRPDQFAVGTVSDRASDYDAARPDLWFKPLFGRGYGTYDHISYRYLDSEILNRLIDTGILGLVALVLMLLSIVAAARWLIRARHPVWTPPALSIAPAAVAFLVLCFLFDISSFPHGPYILVTLAGFLAVISARRDETQDPPEAGAEPDDHEPLVPAQDGQPSPRSVGEGELTGARAGG